MSKRLSSEHSDCSDITANTLLLEQQESKKKTKKNCTNLCDWVPATQSQSIVTRRPDGQRKARGGKKKKKHTHTHTHIPLTNKMQIKAQHGDSDAGVKTKRSKLYPKVDDDWNMESNWVIHTLPLLHYVISRTARRSNAADKSSLHPRAESRQQRRSERR